MIKVICGLGNPGDQYRLTRHNLGFDVIEKLVNRLDGETFEKKRYFDWFRCRSDDRGIDVIKPTTFMNRSGLAVAEALSLFEAMPEELFVISDDFNLTLGRLRIRKLGSAGGHKGLQSIIDAIGSTGFPRLRLGTGPLPDETGRDSAAKIEFVLNRFKAYEEEIVEKMISRAVEALVTVVNKGLDPAINRYNSTNPAPEDEKRG